MSLLPVVGFSCAPAYRVQCDWWRRVRKPIVKQDTYDVSYRRLVALNCLSSLYFRQQVAICELTMNTVLVVEEPEERELKNGGFRELCLHFLLFGPEKLVLFE